MLLHMEESVKGPRAFLTVIDCRPLVPCRFLAVRLGTRSGAKVGFRGPVWVEKAGGVVW